MGKTRLDKEGATQSIINKIANPLKLDLIKAANSIIDIAVSMLIDELRAVSIAKGFDLRDFVMFAFGGAGPMHCAFMARESGIPEIIIPSEPGAFSAFGFLCSDLKHDFVRTRIMRTREMHLPTAEEIFRELELKGIEILKKEGVDAGDIIIERSYDMRYVGQAYELNIPFNLKSFSLQVPETLEKQFNDSYKKNYGHSTPEEPTEIVNFRVTVTGKVKKPRIKEFPYVEKEIAAQASMKVYFQETGWLACPFYSRGTLTPGVRVNGPAIIEEYTSTIVIPPDFNILVDQNLNIILRRCEL
jgi:N-methylhydantoinase A